MAKDETQDITVNYIVTDSQTATDQGSFLITVTGVNDDPVATFTTQQDVNEGDQAINGQLTSTDIDNGDTDTYADTTGGIAGLTINPDGSFSFDATDAAYQDLAVGSTETLVVTYSVTDSEGAVDPSQSFDIVVTGVNNAPVATFNTAQSTNEDDAPLTGTLTATDVDTGDTIAFSLDGQVDGLSLTVADWSFDPSHASYQSLAEGETQDVTVNYIATDSQSATSAGSFVITVTGVNDLTVTSADLYNDATEDSQYVVDVASGVLSNDTDVDNNAQLSAAVSTAPATGTLNLSADGSFTYDPVGNFAGTVTFEYTVHDGHDTSLPAEVTIVVINDNDAPTLVAPTPADGAQINAPEGISLTFVVTGQDVDTGDTLSYTMTGDVPDNATLDGVTGAFEWTPTYEEAGSYDLTLTVTDAANESASVTITLVSEFNDVDSDTLPDSWEVSVGLDPALTDTDGDTIPDQVEVGGDIDAPLNSDGVDDIDALDTDSDNDGITDAVEAGDADLTTPPIDTDSDNTPDYLDSDSDGDGVDDDTDNCHLTQNNDQANNDGDNFGDVCDTDRDGDSVDDVNDNCPDTANLNQTNTDGLNDGGDECDDDDDEDGLTDSTEDADNDGIVDLDETDPLDPDTDADGTNDNADNCPLTSNSNQEDFDTDTIGDACDDDDDNDGLSDTDEISIGTSPVNTDTDGDSFSDLLDICPTISDDQSDNDGDGADFAQGSNKGGDACDDDDDNDGLLDTEEDLDGDNAYDPAIDASNKFSKFTDVDGFNDANDNCPKVSNQDQLNTDQALFDAGNTDVTPDDLGDVCDDDDDGDGIDDADELNTDPLDADSDNDGTIDGSDNCPVDANADQADVNTNGVGDVCDNDADSDGFTNDDETTCGSDPTLNGDTPLDTDGDGDCDNGVDSDDDNDGITDNADSCAAGFIDLGNNVPWTSDPATDHDGDGCRDQDQDTDDDNDTFSDTDEIRCGSSTTDNTDTPALCCS